MQSFNSKEEYFVEIKKELSKNFKQSELIFISEDLAEIEKFLTEHNVFEIKELSNDVYSFIKEKNPTVLFDVSHVVADVKMIVNKKEARLKIGCQKEFKKLLSQFQVPSSIPKKQFSH
jgi:hypothetical protein